MSAVATPRFFNKLYDPLWLFAQCDVVPNAGGAPNTVALMNPHGMPMELIEARWRIYPNNTDNDIFWSLTGMGVGVKMDLGDIPIVDADVPLTSFGTLRDTADRALPDRFFPDPRDTDVLTNALSYRWRLKHPLFVPAGGVLTPGFSHLGQNQFPVTVQSLYICRTLPLNYTPPQNFYVPWVGSYNSIAFDNLASQALKTDFSSELDIVNPFRQPLELSRITGSCTGLFNGDGTQQINVETENYFRYQLAKLRIRARGGDEVARSPTPFNGLFPFGWRAWNIPPGWFLRPADFWKLQLSVAATSATAPADGYLGTVQFSVAATGFRQVPAEAYLAAAVGGEA